MNEQEGIKLKCKKCSNVWIYKGGNPFKAPCSYCGNSVHINTSKVDDEE